MTMTEHLAAADCVPTHVLYDSPRGFANEFTLLPIPTSRKSDTEKYVSDTEDEIDRVVYLMPVEDLTAEKRVTVLDWLSNPGALAEEWETLTGDDEDLAPYLIAAMEARNGNG